MVIAFNAGNAGRGNPRLAQFYKELIRSISAIRPEHQYVLIGGSGLGDSAVKDLPVDVLIIPSVIKTFQRHPGLFGFWLARTLKKVNANILISFDPVFLPQVTLPQLVLTIDPQKTPKLSNRLRAASSIIVVSNSSRRFMEDQFGAPPDRVFGIKPWGLNSERVRADKLAVKNKYSSGMEYFLCLMGKGSPGEMISVLKAYSLFKKRQKSNMKMIFADVKLIGKTGELVETYKYREDVVLLDQIDMAGISQLMESAYAIIDLCSGDESMLRLGSFLLSGVQIITSDDSFLKEIFGDAILYTNLYDPKLFADQLMRVYTDEQIRIRFSEKARVIRNQAGILPIGEQFWKAIEAAV